MYCTLIEYTSSELPREDLCPRVFPGRLTLPQIEAITADSGYQRRAILAESRCGQVVNYLITYSNYILDDEGYELDNGPIDGIGPDVFDDNSLKGEQFTSYHYGRGHLAVRVTYIQMEKALSK